MPKSSSTIYAHLPTRRACRVGEPLHRRRRVERDREPDTGWQAHEALQAPASHGRIRHEDIAGNGAHLLRFVRGRAGEPDRTQRCLSCADPRRLVRLDMRTERQAMRSGVARHPCQVRLETIEIDDRNGRFEGEQVSARVNTRKSGVCHTQFYIL